MERRTNLASQINEKLDIKRYRKWGGRVWRFIIEAPRWGAMQGRSNYVIEDDAKPKGMVIGQNIENHYLK